MLLERVGIGGDPRADTKGGCGIVLVHCGHAAAAASLGDASLSIEYLPRREPRESEVGSERGRWTPQSKHAAPLGDTSNIIIPPPMFRNTHAHTHARTHTCARNTN